MVKVLPKVCPNAVDKREFMMPGLAVIVGKYCARASRTMARAAWTLAAAAAICEEFVVRARKQRRAQCADQGGLVAGNRDGA